MLKLRVLFGGRFFGHRKPLKNKEKHDHKYCNKTTFWLAWPLIAEINVIIKWCTVLTQKRRCNDGDECKHGSFLAIIIQEGLVCVCVQEATGLETQTYVEGMQLLLCFGKCLERLADRKNSKSTKVFFPSKEITDDEMIPPAFALLWPKKHSLLLPSMFRAERRNS